MLLNTDIATQILLLADSLQDLKSTILAARVFLDAYHERRRFITGKILCREALSLPHLTKEVVLDHTEKIVKRLRHDATQDAAMLYEGIGPVMLGPLISVHSTQVTRPYIPWALKLVRLYVRIGPSESIRKLALLEDVYAAVLGLEPYFDPAGSTSATFPARWVSDRQLTSSQRELCRKLALEYTLRGRLRDALHVQKNVLQRMALKDIESNEWRRGVVKTYRALHDVEGAIQYETSIYQIARTNNCLDASLSWARHIIDEYTANSQPEEALKQQQAFLADLQPGTKEYIAWARRLIAMQKRIGRFDDALSTQAYTWANMAITNACYFGWARELADEYRRLYRQKEALQVLEEMYKEAQRQSMRYGRDTRLKYHANQSARALATEYIYCKRFDDARTIQLQIEG